MSDGPSPAPPATSANSSRLACPSAPTSVFGSLIPWTSCHWALGTGCSPSPGPAEEPLLLKATPLPHPQQPPQGALTCTRLTHTHKPHRGLGMLTAIGDGGGGGRMSRSQSPSNQRRCLRPSCLAEAGMQSTQQPGASRGPHAPVKTAPCSAHTVPGRVTLHPDCDPRE